MLSDLWFRARALLRRNLVEEELDAELREHLARLEEKFQGRGLTPAEARRQARLAMGGLEQTREECRDARGTRWLEDAAIDLKYAVRSLTRRPGFLATAVTSLALGIGANLVVFGVVNAMLLNPLRVPEAERIVTVNNGKAPNHSFPNYRDIRDRNTVFESLYAYRIAPVSVAGLEGGRRAWSLLVTGNYFDALKLKPALGRLLAPADDGAAESAPYVVLSYDAWQSRYGADPAIAGRILRLNDRPYTVIGVAPRGFAGTDVFYRSEMWIPMAMQARVEGYSWLESRNNFNAWVGGCLKPGVTLAQADANLAMIAAQLASEHRVNERLSLSASAPGLAGALIRNPVQAFAAGVGLLAGLVLLAACANLASLLAARASERGRELSIRVSLGAGQSRITRQLLTEAMVIAIAGGAAALLLARVLLSALSRARPFADLPFQVDMQVDWRLAAWAWALAIFTGFLFGLAPSRRASRQDPNGVLKGAAPAGAVSRRFGFREGLLTLQVALCSLLVAASLVAVRGLAASLRMPLGLQPQGVSVAGVDLTKPRYDEARSRALRDAILERVSALPGVTHTAYSNSAPLLLDQSRTAVYRPEETDFRPANSINAIYYMVSPGYFAAAGTRLLAGREFNSADRADSPPVAIVNQVLARKLFGTDHATGKRLRLGGGNPVEVVGVVEAGKYESLTEQPRAALFWPMLQRHNSSTLILARSARPEGEVANEIRQIVAELDPALAVFGTGSLEQATGFVYLPSYAAAVALGVFGLLAAMLACTGIYGLTSFAVGGRVRELGIRRAVGARPADILGAVFGRTGLAVGCGTAAGMALSFAASRVLANVIYTASPFDPVVVGGALLLMALAGVGSALGPARRALRIDPARALRME